MPPPVNVYAMTKASMISMTETFAIELGGAGIRVNAIAPGLIDTKLAAAITANEPAQKMFLDRTALRRIGVPDDVAPLAVFLASDDSSYITGATFPVDGGFLAN